MSEGPGIRWSVYLGGYPFATAPSSIGPPVYARAAAQEYLRDTTMVEDRLQAADGDPVLTERFTLNLAWDALVSSDDSRWFRALKARGGVHDFSMFWEIGEAFDFVEGEAIGGTLLRRSVVDVISASYMPADYATRYAPVLWVNDVVQSGLSLGTIANYRQPWTWTGHTAGVGGSTAVVFYTPVYRVMIGEDAPNIATPFAEGWQIVLRET